MSSLRERLVGRIRADGPITYAQYMEAALFDPEAGFYARGPGIGQGGHFATSAMAHPAFADAVAAEAVATWEGLGRPAGFRVTEAGPGTGGLARRVAERLADAGLPFELVLVERSRGLVERQRDALAGIPARWVAHPGELVPAPGFLYANEVLDALPVRLLAWPDEVLVDATPDGRLVEAVAPADPGLLRLLEASVPAPRTGARYAVRPALDALVQALAGGVERGRLLLVDYGGEGEEVHDGRRPPVRTYIGGQPGGDPLQAPGTQDLTADVDFGQLARAAALAGVETERIEAQASWLARHGHRVGPAETRTEADWALAGLLDERLPFVVWSGRR
ncbi:MAG: SAM-dependent methyltransferase [Gaiellales bacterium]